MSFEVRPAVPEDAPHLARLCAQMYGEYAENGIKLPFSLNIEALPDYYEAQIKSRLCHAALAVSGGEPLGFISASLLKPERKFRSLLIGYVADLYVAPRLRRSGAASALLRGAEAWFAENDAALVKIEVLAGNAAGLAFWEARGYGGLMTVLWKDLGGAHVVS